MIANFQRGGKNATKVWRTARLRWHLLLRQIVWMSIMRLMQDTRNVIDEFKGRSEAEIMKELDAKDHGLTIALENTERDFNMGTIVRSANAFGVRQIYATLEPWFEAQYVSDVEPVLLLLLCFQLFLNSFQ